MNAQSTAFDYDDFEQYLLEAARIDRAPSDLPARLGVALGLGVPMVVAAEAASLLPTTSALSGSSTAQVAGVAAPTGIFTSLKASLGVGASTLWNTAAKGIVVGLLSGTAIVGTSQAVVKIIGHGSQKPQTVEAMMVPNRLDNSRPGQHQADAVALDPPPAPAAAVEDLPLSPEQVAAGDSAPPASGKRGADFHPSAVDGTGFDRGVGLGASVDDSGNKRVVRLPRPIFPEKTTAIARYPLIYDDVSALYDTPKKVQAARPVAPPEPEVTIEQTALLAMRTKTLQHSRTLLGQGKASVALTALDSFRKQVGERNFGVDELLLRIEALATLGRAKEAQADVANVEQKAPNSAALRQAQMLAGSRFVR